MAGYADRLMSPEEAVSRFVRDGDSVVSVGAACDTLTRALTDAVRAGRKRDIVLDGCLSLYDAGQADPALAARGFRYKSFFYGPIERAAARAGVASYVPMQYANVARHYRAHPPDVCFVEVRPPDARGLCNIGCMNAGVGPAALERAGTIIASVNPRLTRVFGEGVELPVARVAAFVAREKPMPEYPESPPDEIDRRIGDIILDRIPDGACLQLGIGAMPNALGYGLRGRRHLGIHTELLTPSLIELVRCGAVDNSEKRFMPGVSVCGFFLGRAAQYGYIDNDPGFYFLPHERCNDPYTAARNDRLVSVNNALEVDLCGSVAADCVGFRQYSGAGGQADFVRAAAMSEGGMSYIAMRSTYTEKDGARRSRIVADLTPGTLVTTLRSEVMCVVTEYGCAELWDEDVPTRAGRLIAVAHPDFRDKLTFDARRAGLLY